MRHIYALFTLHWLFSITTAAAQTISNIDPDTAYQGQSLQVNVSGVDLTFLGGTGTSLWLTQGAAEIMATTQSVSNTLLQANLQVPNGVNTGFYDVHVGDYGVNSVELSNGFEVLDALPLLPPPALISPGNGAFVSSNPIIFEWAPVAGATNYKYRVATDPGFNDIVFSGTTVDMEFTTALLNGTYYWRVKTANATFNYGSWSMANEFSVDGPTSLTSINPMEGHQGQTLPVTVSGLNMQFNQATGTINMNLEQGVDYIQLSLSGTTVFNGTDMEYTGDGNLFIPNSAPTGFYDLKYTDLNNMDYLLPMAFEVLSEIAAPAIPDLISPINGVALTNSTVDFLWTAVNNAAEYDLQINTSPDFSSPLIEELDLTQASFSTDLYAATYYWRVRSRSLSENSSPWSAAEVFTVSGVSQLTSLDPNQGYAGQSGLAVQVSGVNLPFAAASSTMANMWLDQNNNIIDAVSGWISSPGGGEVELDIPLAAPIGYYDAHYQPEPYDTISLANAFYVNEGNQYSGMIFIDMDQDLQFTAGDIPYPFGVVSVSPYTDYSISVSDGLFTGYVPSGTHTLTLTDIPYYNVFPQLHTVTFGGTGGSSGSNDFALQPIPGAPHDLMVHLANGNIRQGRDLYTYISVVNQGPIPESGQVSVEFPEGMTVVESDNPNYTVNGYTITWDFFNLLPTEVENIELTLFVPLSFSVGQLVDFAAEVTDVNTDETPLDNVFILENEVVNSYDPNFKEVTPAMHITEEFIENGEFLYYTVHFQNTGNAPAIDVYIHDTISELLQLETFQFISSSHAGVVNMLDNRLIEFRWDGIYLPDSTNNEPESHGAVSYRIKPVSSFTHGPVIDNTAYIYFDFNEPVITNTTENWIPVGIAEWSEEQLFTVQPNPNNGEFILTATRPGDYNIIDLIGNEVYSGSVIQRESIDLTEQGQGVYLVRMRSEGISMTKKIVVY